MNTHDKIELPPLPPLHIAPSVEPVDYPKVAQALMDYARAAVEADRKRRGEPVGYVSPSAIKRLKAGRNAIVGGMSQGFDVPLYAAPQPAEPVGEVLGETCIDGGKCHHGCKERCFRRQCCDPFSDYSGPWEYAAETDSPQPAEPVKESSDILTRLKALNAAATKKYRETASSYYEGQADAYDMAIQIVESAAPQPTEHPKIGAIFETEDGECIGTTDAKVKRVEVQDDGVLTVVIDHWPKPVEPDKQHPDDAAVDAFAVIMKAKLKRARDEKGRGGWQDMSAAELSAMLREHVEKGDPVDVANLAMMLHQNGQGITPAEPDSYVHTAPDDCETLHWRGQILSLNELAAISAEPVSKTNWNSELSSWSDEDFIRIFHERPDLANRLRKMLAETVKVPSDAVAKDAERYRKFIGAGLPITYQGEDYHDKDSLDAAIDATGEP